jgi:hypothetical protein
MEALAQESPATSQTILRKQLYFRLFLLEMKGAVLSESALAARFLFSERVFKLSV